MNLNDLRYLVAVADHRHFGKAAAACFVSQPTLSTQLKKLEQELGVPLVERSPRHVMLTPVGERIVEHARTVVTEADGIRELARRAIDPETGRLTIGIFPTLGPYLLPHVVPAIRARYPRLELLLVEEKTEVVLQRLQEGSLDVGVLAQPVHGRNLHEEPLFEEEFVLAVPAGHPLATAEEPVDTSVLAGHRLLLLDDGHCLRDQALEVCHLAGAGERDDFRATSLETLRQMVNAGVGITLLPELSVRPPVATPEDVRLLRFAAPAPRRRIAMYWRTSSPLGELLTGVAEILRRAPV